MPKQRRTSLSVFEKQLVRWKTGGHCHICGGKLGRKWSADHVVPLRRGGKGSIDNYLPACGICNGLRWHYQPDDIKEILRLGIYARAEARNKTRLGVQIKVLYNKRVLQEQRRRKSNQKRPLLK